MRVRNGRFVRQSTQVRQMHIAHQDARRIKRVLSHVCCCESVDRTGCLPGRENGRKEWLIQHPTCQAKSRWLMNNCTTKNQLGQVYSVAAKHGPDYNLGMLDLSAFYSMRPDARDRLLLEAIQASHRWHYARNRAYRTTLAARGVGADVRPEQLHLLLRVSATTFKSYVEYLGTPFPQDQPRRVLAWLADHLSIELPQERTAALKRRYPSLEALLRHVEILYADRGIEIVTSSGTSGVFTLMVRDREAAEVATRAYFTAIAHVWQIGPQHDMIFVMPTRTRVAMGRIASIGTRVLNWTAESSVAYTMPFAADPDTIRIRAGRTFRTGVRGAWERHALHRFMQWAYRTLAERKVVERTLRALEQSVRSGHPALLLGGLVQLDGIGRHLLAQGGMALLAGSRVATGGGVKESYPRTPDEIRATLRQALRDPNGNPLPVSDVYGMAEAHWAAFQCPEGNYHIPPWVYVAVIDDDDRPVPGSEITGFLAFWDPIGGGNVYPPFFRTADQVCLVNANGYFDPARVCACGDDSPYLKPNSIRRLDLVEEAGCGATL